MLVSFHHIAFCFTTRNKVDIIIYNRVKFCLHCNITALSKFECSHIELLCGLFEKLRFHRENPHKSVKNPHEYLFSFLPNNSANNFQESNSRQLRINHYELRIIFVFLYRTYINDLFKNEEFQELLFGLCLNNYVVQ